MKKIMPKAEFVRVMDLVDHLNLSDEQYDGFVTYIEDAVDDVHHLCAWWLDRGDAYEGLDRVIHDTGELYDVVVKYAAADSVDVRYEQKVHDTVKEITDALNGIVVMIDDNAAKYNNL